MTDFSLLRNILDQNNSFLITTHVNPDADALGSALAFYEILKRLGKKARIVNHSSTPYNLEFLDINNVIEKYDENIHSSIFDEAEVFLLLDLNQGNRIVSMEHGLLNFKGVKICIDHHQDPGSFSDYLFGGIDYSATGEIIFEFIENTGIVEIDKRIAELLYAAIMTDTGSFRFDRTTPRVHYIAAKLLECDVNPTQMYDRIFDQFRAARLKLLGDALSSIKIDSTNQIAYMQITRQLLIKNGASEADIDGFVNYCLSIQNIKIGILLYELNDGIKISFRSKGTIQVNKLAQEFGGGGHTNASGARLFHTAINDIIDIVIESAKKYLEQ